MLNMNYNELDIGGYCYGDSAYIRNMLHARVNEDLTVLPAKKIGLDVSSSALVILYNGRNITTHLISILIKEDLAIKSENGELIFIKKTPVMDWDLYDLKEIDRDSLNLHQDIHELEIILKECLQKCNSFKGRMNDIKVVDSAYGQYWNWRTEKYFCVFHKRRNITSSLIDKLLELDLLYENGGRYVSITDKEADVGFNYHADIVIRNILFYFIPLFLISGLLSLFGGGIIAVLVLTAGITYFILEKREKKLPKSEREKIAYKKQISIYVIKWSIILVVCAIIAMMSLGGVGVLVPILLLIFSIYRYRKIFK